MTTATKVVIKPLEDRIVVRPLEAEQTTASGLVIPDTAKEKPQEGEVLAVGPGRFDDAGTKRVPIDVKVGDIVLYSKYGGTEVKYAGEEYPVLSARDVLAVIESGIEAEIPVHACRQIDSARRHSRKSRWHDKLRPRREAARHDVCRDPDFAGVRRQAESGLRQRSVEDARRAQGRAAR